MIRGGACGCPGLRVLFPVEKEPGRERESVPVQLSVVQPAADPQRRQTPVLHTPPVQSMVVGQTGLTGPSVLVRVLMTSAVMSSPPPDSDSVPVQAPPPLVTRCHPATVALETMWTCRPAASSPTVQWTAAGGRGLRPGSAPPPVGRGCSCQSEPAIVPPPNMEDGSVKDRVLRAASVSVFVQWTGPGLAGPVGGSVPLPVSQ